MTRGRFNLWTAGLAEAKQLCRFVESLAGRVINGGAEPTVAPDRFDQHELGMAAGDEEQQERKGKSLGHARGQGVTFEMVDRDQRPIMRERNRLRRHQADHDAANQSWTRGRRDGVHVVEGMAGTIKGLGDDAVEDDRVSAGGDLGHDAAKGRMLGEIGAHDIRQDGAGAVSVTPDDGGGGIVAA